MLSKYKNFRKNFDNLLSTQEGLEVAVEIEEDIQGVMESFGLDNIEDLIAAYPATAYYENVIETYYEEDIPLSDAERREAVKKYYLERKSALEDAVEDFKNSELYQLYLEVESRLKHYEKLLSEYI